MASSQPLLALQARFVFPVVGPPIVDGVVTVHGSKIVAVGRKTAGTAVRDLGNVAVLPGLVNAHTHLEFSHLAMPLGTPGTSLPDWIRQTVASRRAIADAGHAAAVAHGLRESLAAGTTTLGEIATRDWRPAERGLAPNLRIFFELIAPLADRVPAAILAAEQFLQAVGPAFIYLALSPHAPYTVHPRLLAALVALAQRFQVPLAMHLAESREELELLRSGCGPFCGLLADFNAWDPQRDARYPRVLDYLHQLAHAPRALVIHGNYLDEAETQFLAAHADTMAVVYCPRTHHFFRHAAYPLAQMLELGVSMALGTDSRASNPDLSLFEEMRFVAEHHPELDGAVVLALGTIGGAAALGLADRIGTLEAGKQADFVVVQLDQSTVEDPHELVFAPSARVVQTWAGGHMVYDADAK
jgi:cytosine/adenosine deaminase-related metal-dependent hydrolase